VTCEDEAIGAEASDVVAKQEGVACSTSHTPRTPCQPLAPRILRASAIHPLPSNQHVNEHS
jgi:hypothetical protein